MSIDCPEVSLVAREDGFGPPRVELLIRFDQSVPGYLSGHKIRALDLFVPDSQISLGRLFVVENNFSRVKLSFVSFSAR